MRRVLTGLFCLFAITAFGAAPENQACHRGMHRYKDALYLDSGVQITGTWTCTAGVAACTEDTSSGAATGELVAGDIIDIGGYSYEVASTPDDDTIVRQQIMDNVCDSSTVSDVLIAHTSKSVYIINVGFSDSEYDLISGNGTASIASLSTDQLKLTDAYTDNVDLLRLGNNDQPEAAETTQSSSLDFYLRGVVAGTPADHIAGSIISYKCGSDWVAADETEHDGCFEFDVVDGGVQGVGMTLDETGSLDITNDLTADTVNVGATDVKLSRYTPDAGTTTYLELDQAGTASDGTGTGRTLLDLGSSTYPAISLGDAANALGFYGVSASAIGSLSTSYYIYQTGDVGASNFLTIDSLGTSNELTDTNGRQAMVKIEGEAAQSATGALDALYITTVLTSLGDGSTGDGNNMLNLAPGGTSVWRVSTAGVLTRAAQTVAITIPSSEAAVGAGAPTTNEIGTYWALGFDNVVDLAYFSFEIPDDWDAASDLTMKVYWCAEAGDQIQQTEDVDWDVDITSTDFSADEAYDNGSVYNATATYTEAANPGADKQCLTTSITLVYNNANQPFSADEVLGIKFYRDTASESNGYSGEALVVRWEIEYQSTGIPSHI